jgi:CMP-N-acetylneuraminic acid synthetase
MKIRSFAGTTLCDIILQKVVTSDIPLDNFVFSVYEPELVNIGKEYGVNIFHRSAKSAKSEGWPLTDIYEWYSLPYKYVVLISGCNPLLRVETINEFVNAYVNSYYHGLFGVITKKTYYWNGLCESITPFSDGERIMNTKKVKTTYEAAHCLYASPMEYIERGYFMGDFTAGNPSLYPMPEIEAFDIDVEWQFKVAEVLYQMRNELYA